MGPLDCQFGPPRLSICGPQIVNLGPLDCQFGPPRLSIWGARPPKTQKLTIQPPQNAKTYNFQGGGCHTRHAALGPRDCQFGGLRLSLDCRRAALEHALRYRAPGAGQELTRGSRGHVCNCGLEAILDCFVSSVVPWHWKGINANTKQTKKSLIAAELRPKLYLGCYMHEQTHSRWMKMKEV